MRRRHHPLALFLVVGAALVALVGAAAAPVRTGGAGRAAPPAPSPTAAAKAAFAAKAAELAGVVDTSACPPFVSFFPPGAEDFNVPAAWAASRQRQAGNPFPDRLLPVVMSSVNEVGGSSFVATPPTLQLAVSHPLLGQPGTHVTDLSCMGVRSGAAGAGGGGGGKRGVVVPPPPSGGRRRTLLQQAGYLSKTATYSVTWNLDSHPPSTRTFEPGSTEKPRIMLPELQSMPDGPHCLTLTVTVQPWTGLVGQSQAVPVTPLFVTKRVCFVKLDSPVTADVSFDGCGAPFAVLLANVSLPAVPLVPGKPDAGVLAITALRVRAYLNRTDDSTPIADDARKEIVKWFLLDRPLAPGSVLRYRPAESETPVPGWYNVDVSAYLATNRPGLVSLPTDEGVFPVNDPTVPPPLRGLRFFSVGVSSTNVTGNLVPLQAGATRAFSEMVGPDEYVASQNGAQVSFSWKTDGMGPTYCFQSSGGKPAVARVNDDKGRCRSPFDTHVDQVEGNETLSLSFTDACGGLHARQVEFGRFGWRTVRAIEPAARLAREGIDVDASGSPLVGGAAAETLVPEMGASGGGGGSGMSEYDAGNATAGGALGGGQGGLLQAARQRRAQGVGGGRNGAGGGGATRTTAAVFAAAVAAALAGVL